VSMFLKNSERRTPLNAGFPVVQAHRSIRICYDAPLGNWPGNRQLPNAGEIPGEAQDADSGRRSSCWSATAGPLEQPADITAYHSVTNLWVACCPPAFHRVMTAKM